ncbi:MAG: hypothetical protein Q8P59_02015 [Dehalococcoidia bacterium]|nr:hypothetical protein [Dehalococcoidia bacterium]
MLRTIIRLAILLVVVASILIAGLAAYGYVWLTPYLSDGLQDALENGYCYAPESPNLLAKDWLGVRPEESADLFIRQFIDAYGTFDPALALYKGIPENEVRPRPKSWNITRVCVVGSKKSLASVYITFYHEDGTARNYWLGMWSDAGSYFRRLSHHNLGWLSDESVEFYKANPKYGRKSFHRDASERPLNDKRDQTEGNLNQLLHSWTSPLHIDPMQSFAR